MKLLNKELEKKFAKYHIGSQMDLGGKAKVIAKFFNPVGVGTWLITEADKLENGDYEIYGYCHLGDDEMAEFGYVHLSDLQGIKLPFGLTIERDLYMREDINLIDAMQECGFEIPTFLREDNQEKDIDIEI